MNPIVIWRTKNGYILTKDCGWMDHNDIQNCYVFNNLSAVAQFITLLNETEPKPETGMASQGGQPPSANKRVGISETPKDSVARTAKPKKRTGQRLRAGKRV